MLKMSASGLIGLFRTFEIPAARMVSSS
jgi:hypothetical protein